MKTERKRVWALAATLMGVLALTFAATAGRVLVVDAAEPADVIVVLAGETDRRPAKALQLLDQGYARRVYIDVPAEARIYDTTQLELAKAFVDRLPEAASIRICPIVGLSTWDESHDMEKCLAKEEGSRILIVTSDFHTRRSLSIFRHEVHGKTFSIAAARDDTQFGTRWWTHRQWAKTCLEEWLRVAWWNAIERWR